MKRLITLLLAVPVILFSCKKEDHQVTSKPPDLSIQKEIPMCGVKDVSVALRTNKVQQALAASTDFVFYISIKGGSYLGGAWGAAFNYTTSIGTGLISPSDTLSIFEAIREDYSPWKITVTTDSNLYNSHTVGNRTKIIVAPNLTNVINQGTYGGLSFVGSIQAGFEEPGIVFSDNLSYVINKVQEAISHEGGHTLGLYHQADITGCTLNSAYWAGNGTGVNSWAPIMGLPYAKGITTWASGLTSNFDLPTNCYDVLQNDFTVIASVVAYKTESNEPDNQFGGFYQAIPLGTTGLTKYFQKQGDADTYYIPYFSGSKNLTITTYGDLDVKADLYYVSDRNTKVYSLTDATQPGLGPVSFTMPGAPMTDNSRLIVIKSDTINTNVPNRNYLMGKYTVTIN